MRKRTGRLTSAQTTVIRERICLEESYSDYAEDEDRSTHGPLENFWDAVDVFVLIPADDWPSAPWAFGRDVEGAGVYVCGKSSGREGVDSIGDAFPCNEGCVWRGVKVGGESEKEKRGRDEEEKEARKQWREERKQERARRKSTRLTSHDPSPADLGTPECPPVIAGLFTGPCSANIFNSAHLCAIIPSPPPARLPASVNDDSRPLAGPVEKTSGTDGTPGGSLSHLPVIGKAHSGELSQAKYIDLARPALFNQLHSSELQPLSIRSYAMTASPSPMPLLSMTQEY